MANDEQLLKQTFIGAIYSVVHKLPYHERLLDRSKVNLGAPMYPIQIQKESRFWSGQTWGPTSDSVARAFATVSTKILISNSIGIILDAIGQILNTTEVPLSSSLYPALSSTENTPEYSAREPQPATAPPEMKPAAPPADEQEQNPRSNSPKGECVEDNCFDADLECENIQADVEPIENVPFDDPTTSTRSTFDGYQVLAKIYENSLRPRVRSRPTSDFFVESMEYLKASPLKYILHRNLFMAAEKSERQKTLNQLFTLHDKFKCYIKVCNEDKNVFKPISWLELSEEKKFCCVFKLRHGDENNDLAVALTISFNEAALATALNYDDEFGILLMDKPDLFGTKGTVLKTADGASMVSNWNQSEINLMNDLADEDEDADEYEEEDGADLDYEQEMDMDAETEAEESDEDSTYEEEETEEDIKTASGPKTGQNRIESQVKSMNKKRIAKLNEVVRHKQYDKPSHEQIDVQVKKMQGISSGRKKFICLFKRCDITLTSKKLRKHYEMKHNIKVTTKKHIRGRMQCELCNRIYSYINFKRHIRQVHKDYEYCGQKSCHTLFRPPGAKQAFDAHHADLHSMKEFRHCQMCPYKSKNRQHLQEHIQHMHGYAKPKFICDYCGSEQKYKRQLNKHIKSHVKIGFQCSFCSVVFSSTSRLNAHWRTTWDCPSCRDYKNKSCIVRLRKHQLEVHPEICDTCNEPFIKKSLLETHIRFYHERNTCDVGECKAILNGTRGLRQHKFWSVHSDLVKFCGFCHKNFMDFELEGHRKFHWVNKRA